MTGSRREFLRGAGFGVASLLCGCAGGGALSEGQGGRRQPNILFAIADDWSWPHASIAGDTVVKTPTFDRVAREGVMFTNAYVSSPSCTPSRGAILTGQFHWRLEEGANLWSKLKPKFEVYPAILERAGYHVGLTKKGWGPGDFRAGGRDRNPAGKGYKDFGRFMAERGEGQPFCYWYGGYDPHRPYEWESGVKSGMDPVKVEVPGCFPDCEVVRKDICDYYLEVQRFDKEVGDILVAIERMGELENTIVVITGDNGMPFPRCKSNLYDMGTRMPLAIRWGERVKGGRVVDDFVSLTDIAPTFLEAAGVGVPVAMTGASLMGILTSEKAGRVEQERAHVLTGKERHAWVRWGGLGYPCRAIRTDEFLYIRNFEPDRWPAGDPDDNRIYPLGYGDVDACPTKTYMLEHKDEPEVKRLFESAFLKRAPEELYDLKKDPEQLNNVAGEAEYAQAKAKLAKRLMDELRRTHDPRSVGGGEVFDRYRYFGTTVEGQKPPLIPGRDR